MAGASEPATYQERNAQAKRQRRQRALIGVLALLLLIAFYILFAVSGIAVVRQKQQEAGGGLRSEPAPDGRGASRGQ